MTLSYASIPTPTGADPGYLLRSSAVAAGRRAAHVDALWADVLATEPGSDARAVALAAWRAA